MDAREDAGARNVVRSGKVWPFHVWTRAEAVTFNAFAQAPHIPLVAFGDKGFSPHITSRKRIDASLAKKALALTETGDLEVSKCPFPRHAIVFFDGDLPVASANVCFECGDVLLWPNYWDTFPVSEATPAERAAFKKKRMETEAAHDRVLPEWKAFFSRELNIPTDTRYDP